MAGRQRVNFIKTWVDAWGYKYARFVVYDDDTSEMIDIEIRHGKRAPETPIKQARAKAIEEFENAQT